MGVSEKMSQLKIKHAALKRMQLRIASIDTQIEQQIRTLHSLKEESPSVQHDPLRMEGIVNALGEVRARLQQEKATLQTKIDAVQRRL